MLKSALHAFLALGALAVNLGLSGPANSRDNDPRRNDVREGTFLVNSGVVQGNGSKCGILFFEEFSPGPLPAVDVHLIKGRGRVEVQKLQQRTEPVTLHTFAWCADKAAVDSGAEAAYSVHR
jgi:hypothetical protein